MKRRKACKACLGLYFVLRFFGSNYRSFHFSKSSLTARFIQKFLQNMTSFIVVYLINKVIQEWFKFKYIYINFLNKTSDQTTIVRCDRESGRSPCSRLAPQENWREGGNGRHTSMLMLCTHIDLWMASAANAKAAFEITVHRSICEWKALVFFQKAVLPAAACGCTCMVVSFHMPRESRRPSRYTYTGRSLRLAQPTRDCAKQPKLSKLWRTRANLISMERTNPNQMR